MRTPLTLLVPFLALLVAGCGGAPSPDVEPVATQAERVGALLDAGRPCEALEAMRALDTLAGETGDQEVTAAVSDFVSEARASVTCGSDPEGSPSPTETTPPAREDEDDDGPTGGGDTGNDDGGNGNGSGNADSDDGEVPGRGRGRGNNPGGGP